jgi:hypothetical protein
MRINEIAFRTTATVHAKDHRLFQQSVLRELLLTVLHMCDRDRFKKGRYARAIKSTLKSFDLEGDLRHAYRQALFTYGREVQKIMRLTRAARAKSPDTTRRMTQSDLHAVPVGTQLALDV